MFRKFFFKFLFSSVILGQNKRKRREICWSSVSVSVRMSISRLSVSWKAGAKVADISIHSKYIYHFFTGFLKLICNSLIDNDVVEHNFERRCGRARKGAHYIYVHARKGEKVLGHCFTHHIPLKNTPPLPIPPLSGENNSNGKEELRQYCYRRYK